MAIARQAFGNNVTSGITTCAVTVNSWAIGETALCLVIWYGTQTLSSVSMTGESSLTLIGTAQTGGPDNSRSQWAILSNVTASGNKTLTATTSAAPTAINLLVWRLSGCDTSGANDVDGGASGNSTTPSVNLTTTVDSAAIFAGGSNNGGDITAGTGYTLETVADAYWYDSAQYDIDVGTAGSKTVDATISSASWVWNAVAIKPASSGITGTLARTNTDDTSSATGTSTIVGTLARTNSNDTSSASGTTTLLGTLSSTNNNDILSASGVAGDEASGTVNYTNLNDTLAATGNITIIGTLSVTIGNDTSNAVGTTTILGTLTKTNSNDILTASGVSGELLLNASWKWLSLNKRNGI